MSATREPAAPTAGDNALDTIQRLKSEGYTVIVNRIGNAPLDQAKVIAVAQQMAQRLTLALRSVADAQEADTVAPDYLLHGGDGKADIQVIKSGSIVRGSQSQVQTQ